MKKITKIYADFVSNNATLVLTIALIFSAFMFIGMQLMETQDMDYEDMLPEDYDVIEAFSLISEDFGGTNSGTVVIEIDNEFMNSNEVTSVNDPEVIRYSYKIESYLANVEDVESVSGIGEVVKEKYGVIPNSKRDIDLIAKSIVGENYVSEDESMMLINVIFNDEVNSDDATEEILKLIEEIDKPAGLMVSLTGDVFEGTIINQEIGPDMGRTSMFSVIAIILILILIFRSVKGTVLPLMTIIFGVIWTMGFLGIIGSGLSSMTSGAISMIMGIGIDFGIQVMSRFKQELKDNDKKKAMSNTLNGILGPIITTTLACLIGFRSMSLGELSMMAEMGTIMSYGVLFCMLAAITIVPSLLVIFTKKK